MHTEADCKGRDYRPRNGNHIAYVAPNNSQRADPTALAALAVPNSSNSVTPVARVNKAMQAIIEYSGNFSD
jgi:hypothetical protein